MRVTQFQSVLPVLTQKRSVSKSGMKNVNTKNIELSNFNLCSSLYPVTFTGSQKTPLTDEDYQNAKSNFEDVYKEAEEKYPNYAIELSMLDLDRLNGLQKGIKVFEGLTMKEIGFALKNPIILLNRGCDNNCAHCGYMATPYSKSTLDKMSYEDFTSVVDGIKQLDDRMDNKVSVCANIGTFRDSDCMNIELTDKDGNVYDYVDCLKVLSNVSFIPPLFDTAGWNPNNDKMQKRAEKFVDYITKHEHGRVISDVSVPVSVNVSVNPYHSLYRKSADAKHNFQLRQAKELESMYVNRIANTLFTFTPLLDSNVNFGVLARAKTDDSKAFSKLHNKIVKQLTKMYKNDLNGEQKYVHSKEQMKEYVSEYNSLLYGYDYDSDILPWGRGESLFKEPENNLVKRKAKARDSLQSKNVQYLERGINPDGSVILISDDVSIKTDLELNFINNGKPVKPFANELEDCVYKTSE